MIDFIFLDAQIFLILHYFDLAVSTERLNSRHQDLKRVPLFSESTPEK